VEVFRDNQLGLEADKPAITDSVELTLEINAGSSGYDDRVQRVVLENANQLKATAQEFE
jgi:hypothetical protein